MKKNYDSPCFEFKRIRFIEDALGDSLLPPEVPAEGEYTNPPGDFGGGGGLEDLEP